MLVYAGQCSDATGAVHASLQGRVVMPQGLYMLVYAGQGSDAQGLYMLVYAGQGSDATGAVHASLSRAG